MNQNISKLSERVIGEAAFGIIERVVGSSADEERPFFRVKNLTDGESVALIGKWESAAPGTRLESMTLVVAADSSGVFPEKFKANPDKSITDYRNHNESGLIYVETKVESDAQGLKNIFSLSDRNFLDGTFDDDQAKIPERIVALAWKVAGGGDPGPEGLLSERIVDVLNLIHPKPLSISVRMFTKFALSASMERISCGGNLDPDEIDRLVGRNLVELGLFPYEEWRGEQTDSRISRALELNALRSDLAGSASSDLDVDKLGEQVKMAVFLDPDGGEYAGDELSQWRRLCGSYLESPRRETREKIPYRIFWQLFAKDVKGLQLGDRVHNEIESSDSSRLPEFHDMAVTGGLNRRLQEDAQKFLEAGPDDEGLVPLFDLLSVQTQRMIQKAAYPTPERFTNPLIKAAEIVGEFRDRNDHADSEWCLQIRTAMRGDESSLTAGLFSFLFGSTLQSVIADSKLDPSGIELAVDETLLTVVSPPRIIDDGDDDLEVDEGSDEFSWHPLPIEFLLTSRDGKEQIDIESGYEWLPEAQERVALLWLILAAEDAPTIDQKLRLPDDIRLDEWVSQVTSRTLAMNSAEFEEVPEHVRHHQVLQRFSEIRASLCNSVKESGLNSQLLQDSFDQWSENLERAKYELVPDGLADPRIAAILAQDCMALDDGSRMLMFPSHPFRLRWLGAYLDRSEGLLSNALSGDLPLNRQNGSFYLDWIADLSPHQQPAITCNPNGGLVMASGELGWGEEFSSLDRDIAGVKNASVDPASLKEIASQIIAYLESHPYKRDGLSILVVLTTGAKFPSELIKEIRRGDWKNILVDVHVYAAKEVWGSVSNHFEELPSENRMNNNGKLFPPIQLQFHELNSSANMQEVFHDVSCDIAVIPKFLHDEVVLQENTESPVEKQGRFDPLVDRATHVYGGTRGGAISVSMRPRGAAPAIDAWSTLAVRQERTRPVAPSQPENTDFAEIKINFAQTARLFEEIHKIAHWVVTLERYITREQIETLEPRPDVLTVRDNVGLSGLYTLIVSSHSGRRFIVDRLTRKLRRIADAGGQSAVSRDLAVRIYDETRLIAPRLALQAMGISRVTEEIVGLTIARHIATRYRPVNPSDGVVAWISFDEHPEWFRGISAVRADLCRITLQKVEDELIVDFLVVEGKLRQAYDPHGEEQVAATLELLKDVLPDPEGNYQPIDGELWRDRIASAIEEVAPEARKVFGSSSEEVQAGHSCLPLGLREEFREGRFKVGSFEGLFSICLYDSEGQFDLSQASDERIQIARSYRNQVLSLVEAEPLGESGQGSPSLGPAAGNQGGDPDTSLNPAGTDSGKKQPQKQEVDDDTISEIFGSTDREEAEQSLEAKAEKTSGSEGPVHETSESRNKLSPRELERRYQVILDTYGQFDVPVHKPDKPEDRFIEGPASILFRLRPGIGVDPKSVYGKADSLKLGLALDEQQSIRFSIHLGNVNIDVPKGEKDRYFVNAKELWERWSKPEDALEVPLGEDHLGDLVRVNFSSSNSPHLLIGGTTGSGKSEALNTILEGLIQHYSEKELRLQLIDPKSTELLRFEECPHLLGGIGYEAEEAINLLKDAVDQMQWRYKRFRELKTNSLPKFNALSDPDNRLPWWVIVLDEYADLTSDPGEKKEIEALLKRLAQKARAAGIHVIIATQKPSSEVISTSLRSNLPAQLALRVKSATESRVIMDESGAETLNGKGDAFFKAEGELIRTQCALVDEE